jgi:hypothetical protein
VSEYNMSGSMLHCTIPLPKPQVGPLHPFKNAKMHEKLLCYVQQRLMLGKNVRDTDLSRLVRVDKKVAGWLKLSREDKVRAQTQDREGKPVITQMNLPLAWVHLDDMMTYYAATFAPNRGMFYHTGKPGEVDEASQIVTKMNNDAIQSGAYREILLGLFSLLKYNKGGFWCNWSSESGPTLVQTAQGQEPQVQMEIRWSGNKMTAVDNYNFLYDASVPLHKLHTDGEFAAHVDLRSYYWLQSRAGAGIYYNLEEYLKNPASQIGTNMSYYRNPPQQAQFDTNDNTGVDNSGTDWVSILSESSGYVKANGYEVVTCYIRINPTEFGLVTGKADVKAVRNRYEVWRISILNDECIIGADYMNNIHGYLPCFVGTMNDDVMGAAQRSAAEILTPLQDFASFLVNTHVAGARKNLYGTTFFDPTMVDLDQVPQGEVAARVKIKPAAYGKDIRTYIYQMEASQDTSQTLQDLSGIMSLVDQFFPTQSLPSQIANIDRAVDSQVAAVQQGANRRQQKAARLLDDSVFRNVRFAMYYNIIQYAADQEKVVDAFTGQTVTIDLQSLRNSNLPYIIGQGLKAIDRMAAAGMLQNIIFALIQAPQAAQGLDLLGLIDYWTSMIDIDIDMKQFRLQPTGQTNPDGTPEVADSAGNPIAPATNPAAVTTPIRG